MVEIEYIPEKGDIVWLDFNPQTGREQMGRRPAMVLSPKSYNNKTSLFIALPITSKSKNYPFEVKLKAKQVTKGVIISDQVKSLDWRKRNVEFIEKADLETLNESINKLTLLIK